MADDAPPTRLPTHAPNPNASRAPDAAAARRRQRDLGPRRDGRVGATNKSLHDPRYFKDRVCDAPKRLETAAPAPETAPRRLAAKRLDPKLGDLDSGRPARKGVAAATSAHQGRNRRSRDVGALGA